MDRSLLLDRSARESTFREEEDLVRVAPPLLLMAEPAPLFCDRCLKELRFGQGEFYLVRIEALLDPTPPEFTEEDLVRDVTTELDQLVQQLNHLTPQEAQDQVHRKLVLYLCLACYRKWIDNPTGQ